MRSLGLTGLQRVPAQLQICMPRCFPGGLSGLRYAPLAAYAARSYHVTPQRHRAQNDTASPSASTHAQRGEEIRRHEELFRWLRRLVVPSFLLLGLFVLRPTEGHFLRYVAERRHLDTDFNAWFPPVAVAAVDCDEPANAAAASSSMKASGKGVEGTANTRTAASASTGEEGRTPFRSPQDREWAAQKFNYRKGSEDEERVARRRLLFARERAYMADDTVVETIRSPEAQREELRALREHPPMHLLRDQLDAMAEESKRYSTAAAEATTVAPSPPQVFIQFEDHRLFAVGEVVFRDQSGKAGRTMRFVGACGMLWRQTS